MSALAEQLRGSADIMFGQSRGLARLDTGFEGFKFSFWGLALAALIDMSALAATYGVTDLASSETVSRAAYVFGNVAIAGLAYGAGMVALYLLSRSGGDAARFPATVIAHNWAAPLVSLFVLPVVFVNGLARQITDAPPEGLAALLPLFVLGLLCLAGIRLIRIPLDISTGKAAAYFVVTTLVSLIVSEGMETMLGLSANG